MANSITGHVPESVESTSQTRS